MLSTSPFRWHKPDRKLSTPFFPGAWPNNSTHSALVSTSDGREPEDIEAQLQNTAQTGKIEGSSSSLNIAELPHEDRVMAFHARMSRTFGHGQAEDTRTDKQAPTGMEMSSTLSESSQMSMLTKGTSSSCVSDSILTPGILSPSNSMLSPLLPRKSRESRKSNRFSFQRIILEDKDVNDPDRNRVGLAPDGPSLPSSLENANSTTSASSLTSSAPGLPPLSLPSHTLSFSPESVASYFSVSDQSSRINTTFSSGSPVSPSAFSPPESTSSPGAFPDACDIASPSLITTTLQCPEAESPPRGMHETRTHRVSSSMPDTDSPVLPSDEDENVGILPSQRSRHFRLTQVLAPSSADMDAFGLAASGEPDARSTRSIPTSFRSAFAAESVFQSQSLSIDSAARGRARRQSSASLSLSLSLSEDSVARNEESLDRVRNTNDNTRETENVYNSPPRTYPPANTSDNTTSAIVTGGSRAHDSGPSRFLGFDKVKRLGGRIKQLFKGKPMVGNVEGAIGVTTTTAVTAVEYKSEHPIALSKGTKKGKHLEKKLHGAPDSTRRQSMPAPSIGSLLTVSSPRPLRPNSVLVLNDLSEQPTRKMSSASLSSDRQQPKDRPPPSRVSVQSSIPVTAAQALEGTGNDLTMSTTSTPAVALWARSRTQTAPHKPAQVAPRKSRRLSLSSPISRSRLDILKTAITPHPPLPQHVTKFIREDVKVHSRVGNAGVNSKNKDSMPIGAEVEDSVGIDDDVRPGPSREGKAPSTLVVRDTQPKRHLNPSGIEEEKRHDQRNAGTDEIYNKVEDDKILQTPRAPTKAAVENQYRQSPGESHVAQGKGRRSRGFSLSSVISSRAMKAKSLILGRVGGQDPEARLPHLPANTTARIGNESALSPTSSVGCAEYEPDLILDNISFAHMSALTSSAVSTEEILAREPEDGVHAILTSSIITDGDIIVGESSQELDNEADEIEDGREEREEERGLMRALGLPFDKPAQRAV